MYRRYWRKFPMFLTLLAPAKYRLVAVDFEGWVRARARTWVSVQTTWSGLVSRETCGWPSAPLVSLSPIFVMSKRFESDLEYKQTVV